MKSLKKGLLLAVVVLALLVSCKSKEEKALDAYKEAVEAAEDIYEEYGY